MHYVFLWKSSVYVKCFLPRKPVDTPCGVSRKRESPHGAYLSLSHHHVSFWNRSFVDLQILRERISECLPSFAKQVVFLKFLLHSKPTFSLWKLLFLVGSSPLKIDDLLHKKCYPAQSTSIWTDTCNQTHEQHRELLPWMKNCLEPSRA